MGCGSSKIGSKKHLKQVVPEPIGAQPQPRCEVDAAVGAAPSTGTKSEFVNLLVIDTQASPNGVLIKAALPTTLVVSYDSTTDSVAHLAQLIGSARAQSAHKAFRHVALATHGGEVWKMTTDLQVPMTGGQSNLPIAVNAAAPMMSVLVECLATGGRIDLLSCCLLKYQPDLALTLEQKYKVNFAASDDETGNMEQGGDWVLESDGVDVKDVYWDGEALLEYQITMWGGFDKIRKKAQKTAAKAQKNVEKTVVATAETAIEKTVDPARETAEKAVDMAKEQAEDAGLPAHLIDDAIDAAMDKLNAKTLPYQELLMVDNWAKLGGAKHIPKEVFPENLFGGGKIRQMLIDAGLTDTMTPQKALGNKLCRHIFKGKQGEKVKAQAAQIDELAEAVTEMLEQQPLPSISSLIKDVEAEIRELCDALNELVALPLLIGYAKKYPKV
jgi:hypothetical protein